ncbi:MAG: DUF6515 family protein [Chitinophagales bacterium]
MKTLQKYSFLLLVAAGFITPAFAQRGDHHGGGNQGGGGGSNRQNSSSFHQNSFSRQNNSFGGRQDRPTNFNQSRQNFQTLNRDNRNNTSSFSSRVRSQDNNNNSFIQRNNRVNYQSNLTRVNNSFRTNSIARYDYGRRGYSNGYSNHYNNYNRYNYGYFPRRYTYGGYSHYSILPRSFISISFGGYPYYYGNGLFYSYYNGFYEPVYAPFGICVNTLPYGYYPFYWGGMPYYYYDGVYYRDHGDNQYEVVDAPMGAVVSELPKGAKAVTVNGEKFYEFNGTYYKEGANDKNEVVYTVVGKNGEINNSDDANVNSSNQLRVGDIVSKLPDNSRQVTINGQTLFVSPDNFYFKQRSDNGAVSYEVVGSDEQTNQ